MSNELIRYDAACKAITAAKAVDEALTIRNSADALRAYARQAKNKGAEVDMAEIRIRAERRVGELMTAQRETEGLATGAAGGGKRDGLRGSLMDPRDARPTLAEAGIDKHLADRARKLSSVPKDEFEEKISEWRGRVSSETERVTTDLLKSGTAHVAYNSGNNEWYTPDDLIAAAREVLGGIDLDPASNKAANDRIKATSYFTSENDGLQKEWRGSVWMNPPYSQPEGGFFADKLKAEVEAGRVTAALVLVNNATETQWFKALVSVSSAVCFPSGRVKFWSPHRESATPLQGQAVLYIGPFRKDFGELFESFGHVWYKQ